MEAVKLRRRPGVQEAAGECAAHALLFAFTFVLVLKLHHLLSSSWWLVFSPLLLFHIFFASGRLSVPAPIHLDFASWYPLHAAVATPLLVAFELLLCIYLESSYVNHVAVVGLNIVFLPLYLLGAIIILDNLRMCYPLILLHMGLIFLGKEREPSLERKLDELGYDVHAHFCTIVAMASILGATVYMVLILNDTTAPEVNLRPPHGIFGAGELFVCLALYFRNLEKRKRQNFDRPCTGVHVMMAPIFVFQVLLYMYLQGAPARAREIPIPYIFSPLFLLQGLGVVFSASQLVETTLQHSEARSGQSFKLSSRARDFLELMRHGSGFPGWWSPDEASKEAQAQRIHYTLAQETRDEGCNTFCGNPPDLVKKMSKKDLVEEVLALQAAISKQMEDTGSTRQEYEWLRYKKKLCRFCFETEIEVVLYPCKHRFLCGCCCWVYSRCPHCCAYIQARVNVY